MKFAAGPALRALNEAARWCCSQAGDWCIALSVDASGGHMPAWLHTEASVGVWDSLPRGLDSGDDCWLQGHSLVLIEDQLPNRPLHTVWTRKTSTPSRQPILE
jgi:hypothetical protein